MTILVLESSKYLMIFFMLVYAYLNFRFFGVKYDIRRKKLCRRQNQLMFLIHFLLFFSLYLNRNDETILVFYLAQVIFLGVYMTLSKLFYRNISRLLLNNMCLLISVGLLILTRLNMERATRQFAIIVVSAVFSWIIPFIVDRVWQLSRIPWLYGVLGLVLLAVVCVAGITSYGAKMTLELGSFSFQPAEFVKISFVFFVATMFYRATDFKTVCITTAMAAGHVLILVLSKDLGNGLIFFLTYIFMLFVATSNYLYLGAGLTAGGAAAVLAYRLFPHVQTRVQAWLDPWSDVADKGYQIAQSLFAIGTGGWFGMGLDQGIPEKIPVVEKDFVISAIAEEMGGIFAVCLILICLGCFLQFMMIAARMQAVFYKLIAFGLGCEYIIQVFLTVGGAVKFIPLTGMTLPLVSYGGSSIVGTFILFQVIQGLYILKRNEEEEDEEERTQSKSK